MKHLFRALFFCCNFLVSGFEQSTIVWSDKDQISIASITKNDKILAFDSEVFCHNRVVIAPIKIAVDSYIAIELEGDAQPIICSRFQQFLTIDHVWKKALDLMTGDCLLGVQSATIELISVIYEPITLYDLCVIPNHTFCVGKHKVVAHNFAPFIGLTISLLFGAGTAFEWSIVGGIAVAGLGLFGCGMNKNKKATVTPIISPNQPNGGNNPNKNNDDNERKFNVISKTVFFKKVKDKY